MIKLYPTHKGAIWEVVSQMVFPDSDLIIDLGGGIATLGRANYIVDLKSYQERGGARGEPCFDESTWIQADLNDPEWSERFPDKYFDLVWCNHTLEDIRDPIGLLRTITRIGKRSLIGAPHWTYETHIVSHSKDWEMISGWPHHRWLVGINKATNVLEFMAKLNWLVAGETETEDYNLNIEWDGGDFQFAEITNIYPGNMIRTELIEWLRERWL